MDKNTLLARVFNDRQLRSVQSALTRHRLTSRIDPFTGDYGYMTLDCRDGQHDACEVCDCPHHGAVTR